MAYLTTFRPTVLFFFLIRQPVAATAIISGWAFWEADRNFDLGIRKAITSFRQGVFGFPTDTERWAAFKKIDEEKRNELALKQ
ncbi:unnamed protein product [[Candida] boidinii]|uniref:Unnamed protein product n=1 Tax=Candida boidinii TaxID=5477 RepID=A0A9W6SXI2_CANBO|nr:hypothetical protein BVG19_g1172 [[Candida] boidinii]OWB52323.1 hypothetical protein B5S27_g3897 [[Candida] boidinii]OWB66315.1 hypothetical protein B5S30_g1654 [[Candida] boidinii]OWB83775.1 hypothetical protein B5S33_g2408 [[Candida] boidinii]GME69214.1 unnamed protein product [[Candida] boidinii]